MKKEEFKKWLEYKYPDSPTTVGNRISNCLNVEKFYNDLDIHIKKDNCKTIIEELTYTTEDERSNSIPKHPVVINGNLRTGSATLKQAVRLYVDFYSDYINTNSLDTNNKSDVPKDNNILSDVYNKVINFNYDIKKHADVNVLQLEVIEYLKSLLPMYEWDIECHISDKYKDRVDIMGVSKTSDYIVVIELDAHRADQIAKKFVSRMALLMERKVVYIALCYPGTDNMPKPEAQKYFNYCTQIAKQLSTGAAEKHFEGILLQ
ncbi:hypothetical protein [Plebeiibacterium sediminum]|uniref:Uncharacterized protein n=1 Tax=Plebeiibacterium sediminum TaxID=2992112 RepID=A0AAE3M415_9BACT|nr:hypothetical protein [Plebeiobacterium sediminum]MCW3786866.1 hypothetical protein [Plebeiobacterium sediminum]